jgi:hypothetical protein
MCCLDVYARVLIFRRVEKLEDKGKSWRGRWHVSRSTDESTGIPNGREILVSDCQDQPGMLGLIVTCRDRQLEARWRPIQAQTGFVSRGSPEAARKNL